ncbi:MAG: glutamine amidotransferase, partial [Proteobacteria bacterium]|nr:glutamine amidotransferase [Pseudomonadota bacterium]
MCGIVGLFIKKPELEKSLGALLSPMLVEMTERGPDSAGIAIYGDSVPKGMTKMTVLSIDPDYSWDKLSKEVKEVFGASAEIKLNSNHAILTVRTQPKT